MPNFKTTYSVFTSVALASVLAACGGTNNNPVDSSSSQQSSMSQSSMSSSQPSSSSSSSVQMSSSSVSSSSSVGAGNMPLILAINAGASDAVTLDGVEYKTDQYSRGGSRNNTTDNISGASNGALYQTERYGAYSYEIPVTASGRYTIQLHFAEIYLEEAGARRFSVRVEGNTEISNLDLYAMVGHDSAYSYWAEDVQVSDGALTIELVEGIENPTLAGFAVYSYDGEVDTSVTPGPIFSGEKFVGNITTRGQVRSDFARYWDQITPENEGKWGSVEGTRDQYNWGPVDRIYEFARQNNIPVKAHTMVWGQQAPSWINNLSAADQRSEIEEWIRDYCQRYPDTAMMDVVNEAHPNHAPANYARNAFGNNWITEVFRLARQHCPNTKLLYNDYNFMTWDTDVILDLIRPAVNAGVVDGLGVQAHSLNDPKIWSAQELKEKIDLISSLGVPVYVSEYDIEAPNNDQHQLQMFQSQFPVFYEHPNVAGITLWGYVVGTTWREGTGLIQSNGQHRPAMDWLMNYLGRN